MTCKRCRIDYPSTLVTRALTGSHNYSQVPLCGVCVFEIDKELYGENSPIKWGITATMMYNLANEFRELHPKLTPHSNPTKAQWVKL